MGPYGYQHVFGGPVVSQEMEEEEEEEEEEVGGSYMGDELDLKTVGDIIAIIEEKVMTFTRDTRGGTCHQRLCCGSFVTSGQPR